MRKKLGKLTANALLILDIFEAHRGEELKQLLRKHRIHLCFVPPTCTDELQPMDQIPNKQLCQN
jgi:transposase